MDYILSIPFVVVVVDDGMDDDTLMTVAEGIPHGCQNEIEE